MLNSRPSDLTDDDLIKQAQGGNSDAFEILFERYRVFVFLLIFRIVRDEYLAHDVLQSVFIQLYRSLPILIPRETLRAWLSQVARNRSIDELRRRRVLLFSEIEPFPGGGNESESSFLAMLPDPEHQPEKQVELHELRQSILDAIETLPLIYRPIVLYRYDSQMSFREIGQVLSIPEATAKKYFYQARKRLRTVLEAELEYC